MKVSSRLRPRLLPFLILFIVSAVIFWGLYDKVSLYRAGVAGHPIAKAKLLSGRELAGDTANVSAPEPPAEPAPLAATCFAAALLLLCKVKLRESAEDRVPFRNLESSGLTSLLLWRPPPRSAFSRA